MTDDYKQKIFDYIIGDYDIENPGENEPLIINESSNVTNIYQFVFDYLTSTYGDTWHGAIYKTFRSVNEDENGNQYIGLLLQVSNTETSEEKSCICICDGSFKPLKVLSRFKNGTEFRIIDDIDVSENGTLYGIDSISAGVQPRFIMLNNIFLAKNNDFYIELRYSLNIPNQAYYMFVPNMIKKCYNESSYVITRMSSARNFYVTYLKIEATESPEWRMFLGTNIIDTITTYDLSIKKNNDDYDMLVTGIEDNIIYIFNCSTSQENNDLNIDIITISNNEIEDIIIKEIDNSIYCIGDEKEERKCNIIKITGNHNSYTYSTIKIFNAPESFTEIIGISGEIVKNNNEIFYGIGFFGSNSEKESIFGMVYNDEKCSEYHTNNRYELNLVTKQYNLYKYYSLVYDYDFDEDYINIYDQIWNENNYNGIEYQDFNSLIPNSTYLKDNYGIQFARNILNNTYFNNIETSTVQIPNLFINGLNIVQSNLLGITNNKIIEDNSSFQKNIYEEVYINFINQYKVLDRNEEQQKIMPIQDGYASNDIVGSLEIPQENYNNIKLTKYRLNYTDETSKIINLDVVTKENRLIKYLLSFYIEKELKSIDFISNDGNTIYLTIENNGRFEIGKYYSLTQEMTIE